MHRKHHRLDCAITICLYNRIIERAGSGIFFPFIEDTITIRQIQRLVRRFQYSQMKRNEGIAAGCINRRMGIIPRYRIGLTPWRLVWLILRNGYFGPGRMMNMQSRTKWKFRELRILSLRL